MPVRRYRFILLAGIAILALLAAGARPARAQRQQNEHIVLNNVRSLDFGRFVAGSGGTIVVGPTGVRSRTGAVVLLNSPNAGQAALHASRSGNGGVNRAVIVTAPFDGVTRLASGSNSMAVDHFVGAQAALLDGLPAGGMTLAFGATLTVAPNQAPGNYSGTFSVIVNYQ